MTLIATLRVELTAPSQVTSTFNAHEIHVSASLDVPHLDEKLEDCSRNGYLLCWTNAVVLAAIHQQLADGLAAVALPPKLLRAMRRWITSVYGPAVLGVSSDDESLIQLPWEILPYHLKSSDLRVVRLSNPIGTDSPGASPPSSRGQSHGTQEDLGRRGGGGYDGAIRGGSAIRGGRGGAAPRGATATHENSYETGICRVLVAGWPDFGGREYPGITTEMDGIVQVLGQPGVQTELSSAPTPARLQDALMQSQPGLVHLVPAGIDLSQDEPRSGFYDDDGVEQWMATSQLCNLMADHVESTPELVVINTYNSGLKMARHLSQALQTVTVGWPTLITDDEAANFASYFYQRLIEGETVVEAVARYLGTTAIGHARLHHGFPVVWMPSLDRIAWSPWSVDPGTPADPMDYPLDLGETVRSGTGQMVRSGGTKTRNKKPRVRLELRSMDDINPAMLCNGVPAVSQLRITSNVALDDAHLRIECDTGRGISTVRRRVDLIEGEQPVVTEDLDFPVLYELIRERTGRRRINFVATLSNREGVLDEATCSALWMSHDEWLDNRDLWQYVPAFVRPNDHAVLEILDHAVLVLKFLGDPSGEFRGYLVEDESKVVMQVRAIFQALCNDPLSLTYEAAAAPVFSAGTRRYAGQRVRPPREILEHRRGTCHDLTLLFASCVERIGIHPVLIMISGHTFFGFWKNSRAQQRFMTQQGEYPNGAFPSWIISELRVLEDLHREGAIEVLEATTVGNADASYEKARNVGNRQLQRLGCGRNGRNFDAAIDVFAARHAVQPVHTD